MDIALTEETLAEECKEHWLTVTQGLQSVAKGYWQIGKAFIAYEEQGIIKREHGQGTVDKIAGTLSISRSYLYAAINFAEAYPEWHTAHMMINDRVRQGLSAEWYYIRTQVLPKNTREPTIDRHHQIMNKVEKAAGNLEAMIGELTTVAQEDEAPVEELGNVIAAASQVTHQAQETLNAVKAHPKPQREKDTDYLDWLKQQSEWACIMTGDLEADACHLTSIGAGGSDLWCFPLTRELHSKSHQDIEFFYKHRQKIAEWFYLLPRLHERFHAEKGNRIEEQPN